MALPGRSRRTPGARCGNHPPSVVLRALAFVTTSHRPSYLRRSGCAAGDAAFSERRSGCPARRPVVTVHADPVARATALGADRNLAPLGQLGWPRFTQLRTTARCHPTSPGRRSDPPKRNDPLPRRHRRSPDGTSSPSSAMVPHHPGRSRRPSQLPAPAADRTAFRLPGSPPEWLGEYVPCSDPAAPSRPLSASAEAAASLARSGVRFPEQ